MSVVPPAADESLLELHHVGVAVNDIDAAAGFYASFLGYAALGPSVADPRHGVRVRFFAPPGPVDPLLELVSPLGTDSPVANVLTNGGGAYHVCYTAADLDAAIALARAAGALVVSPPTPAVAFGGRPIAWCYSPGRQLIELAERGSEPRRPAS
ncbi:MAG: VOC family protein [Acidimicrobiia bacterium]|nr:VOC family protein [Acidimicrobiia bacterium]